MEEEEIKQKKLNTPYPVKTVGDTLAVKDVDLTKRIVTGFFNASNFFDSDRDVIIPGAGLKSITTRGPQSTAIAKIKHAFNHDLSKLVGNILVLEEKTIDGIDGLYFESKMSNSTLGNDTLINYQEKIYDNHSIGFQYMDLAFAKKESENEDVRNRWFKYINQVVNKEDAEEVGHMWIVKEYKLWEGSTVSFGANELTPFLGVKSKDKGTIKMQLHNRLDSFTDQLKSGKQSDEMMKEFELHSAQIKQMINELVDSEKTEKEKIAEKTEEKKKSFVELYLEI